MVARIILVIVSYILLQEVVGQDLSCGTPEPTLAQQKMLDRLIEFEKQGDLRVAAAPSEIAIVAHVVRRSDGTGGLTEQELQDALDNVNSFYANANMSFFYLDIQYIDEDKYYDFIRSDQAELTSKYSYNDIINIYFTNSVGNGEGLFYCGYAYFPGGPDIIFMDNSCTLNGSTLPHEIGHFFALYHTHGTTNTGTTDEVVIRPGEESVGCVEPDCTPVASNCDTNGDRLCDTEADPNVSGKIDADCNYTEATVDVNGDLFRPDGTNIMSYSSKSCRNIFSDGQYERMNLAYLNDRNYLHTKYLMAEFNLSDKEICEGESIDYNSDRSINASSFSWTFEGGTPATSSDANPTVEYFTDGVFDVTLTITDDDGNEDVKTFTDFVNVRGELIPNSTPLSGSFEEVTLQEMVISGGSGTWVQTTVASDGSKSAYVVLVFMTNGQEDYLVLDPLNTSVDKTFQLTFDYAYAPLDENTEDILEIVYRDPCGEWQSVWSKKGQDLATAPNENQVYFFPTSDQWVSESIIFDLPEGLDIAEIAFKTTSDNGNSLFIDNYSLNFYDPSFTISDIEITKASCPDAEDGSFKVQLSLEDTYEFFLGGESSGSTGVFDGLIPGTYDLTVRNVYNYEQTEEVIIGYENEYPTTPEITQSNGQLTIKIEENQTIQWFLDGVELEGETSNSLKLTQSGSYSVSVANGGCSVLSDKFNGVYDPGFGISNISVAEASCPGIEDGSFEIVIDGDGVFEYSIDGGTFSTSNFFSGLAAGTYTVVVKNASNDEISAEVIIGYENEYPAKPVISENEGRLSVDIEEGQTVQWFLNGVGMTQETNNEIEFSEAGSYVVSVSNGSCSMISDEFIILSTKLIDDNLKLYPNPVENVLSISLNEDLRGAVISVSIKDLTGKELIQGGFETQIDLSNLKSGIYILSLLDSEGEVNRRFVKQ